jgi:hypothetical protein
VPIRKYTIEEKGKALYLSFLKTDKKTIRAPIRVERHKAPLNPGFCDETPSVLSAAIRHFGGLSVNSNSRKQPQSQSHGGAREISQRLWRSRVIVF